MFKLDAIKGMKSTQGLVSTAEFFYEIFHETTESFVQFFLLLFNLYCTIRPAGHSINFSNFIVK